MSIVRLDITKQRSSKEIESFLKKKNLKKGDTLKILKGKDTSEIELTQVLMMIIGFGLILFHGKKGKLKSIPITDSIDELEKFAAAEAGMKIDIEPKPKASYDSNDKYEFSPLIKSLLGAVKVAENQADYKTLLEDELLKKHLK